MINKTFFIFILLFFLNNKAFSANIVVIDLEYLIENSTFFLEVVKKIELNQKKYLKEFNSTELSFKKEKDEIENSKQILDASEIDILINSYNNKLIEFETLIDNFNQHYETELIKIKKKIFDEIIILIENYIKDNNVDLVLDSTSYIIASNSIDITKIIENELDNINIKLDFKDFEKN